MKGRPPRYWRAFLFARNMNLDFSKADGLITAVIQDAASGRVLMVGYMNEEAFRKTDAEVWDLRVEVLGEERAAQRSTEKGSHSPVELY